MSPSKPSAKASKSTAAPKPRAKAKESATKKTTSKLEKVVRKVAPAKKATKVKAKAVAKKIAATDAVGKDGLPIIGFATQAQWAAWLQRHHDSSAGIWMMLYKKNSGLTSIDYAQALEEALCWGWIDGQKKSYDDVAWLQRFTQRRKRSVWSKVNTQHVARLINEGRMQPSGLLHVDAAKADGRWDVAYDSSSTAKIPDDLQEALQKHPAALTFFQTLNKASHYVLTYRLQTARTPQTRQRRIEQFLEMMSQGKKFF